MAGIQRKCLETKLRIAGDTKQREVLSENQGVSISSTRVRAYNNNNNTSNDHGGFRVEPQWSHSRT